MDRTIGDENFDQVQAQKEFVPLEDGDTEGTDMDCASAYLLDHAMGR